MKKTLSIFSFVLLATNFLCAQTPTIDSLRRELAKTKPDSIKVHDRIRISWYLIEIKDSAAAWQYITEADSIADKTKNPVSKGIVYEHMGFLYNRMFSKKAITYYLQAENILKDFPNSMAAKKSMASLGLNIGIEHMNANDDEGALVYYFDAIKKYEALDSNHKNIPILYSSIISSYYNLGKFETALTYCQKAYQKSMSSGNSASKMSACINYGRVLRKLKQKEKAQAFFAQGLAMADSLNDPYFQSKYYQVLGNFAFDENKFSEALAYFSKALPIIKLTNAPYDIASCFIWMGACHAGTKNFDAGRNYLDSAFSIAKEYDYVHQQKDVYRNRYHLEKRQGNFASAISYLDSFNVINDSLLLVAQSDRIEFLDAKYQAEKQQSQITNLQSQTLVQQLSLTKKNTLNYILAGGVGAILIISLLSYRSYKNKQKLQQQKIEALETEKQLTATEAVLKGEEQERSRLAKDLHDGLGGMLSGIKYSLNTMKGNLIMTPENAQAFERSMDMLDSSIQEMRRVAHNMMPEALVKFGLDTALKDFCTDINKTGAINLGCQTLGLNEGTIDQSTSVAIYRIVQELINNTIKHAAAKNAIIQVTKNDGLITITVEDDGKGFDTSILNAAKGIGWMNIKNRVEFLKGKLDVQSTTESGTSVHIELNV